VVVEGLVGTGRKCTTISRRASALPLHRLNGTPAQRQISSRKVTSAKEGRSFSPAWAAM
jgi:hypothetical protein